MSRFFNITKLALTAFLLLTRSAFAVPFAEKPPEAPRSQATWYLPIVLDDKNTKVTFDIDSTWHMVHGTTSGVSGMLHLIKAQDPNSLKGEIRFPVANFKTADNDRDEKLREIFNEPVYKEVVYVVDHAELACRPDTVSANGCKGTLFGTLSIHGNNRLVQLPILIVKTGQRFEISGSIVIPWEDYNVEDPSIFLIARVEKTAKVTFSVTLAQ